MATILAFRPVARSRSSVADPDAPAIALGDVVLFTGVRYERANPQSGSAHINRAGDGPVRMSGMRDEDQAH